MYMAQIETFPRDRELSINWPELPRFAMYSPFPKQFRSIARRNGYSTTPYIARTHTHTHTHTQRRPLKLDSRWLFCSYGSTVGCDTVVSGQKLLTFF